MNNQDSFDATQRVYLDPDGHPTTPPKPQQPVRPPRPSASERAAQKRRKQRIMLISIIAAAVVLLIVLGIILVNTLNKPAVDDGKIISNVYAAGINIGGMTPEQAKEALQKATAQTYSVKDLVVTVDMSASGDATLIFPADKTGAKLNVDAVVQAAYDLGRTGSRSEQQEALKKSESTGHDLSIVPYLGLNSSYIKGEIDALGAQYSTLLKESTYSFTGTRPNMEQDSYDTTIAYQTLIVRMGTPYYELNTTDLYEKVLSCYDSNKFELSYACSVQLPKELDCLAIYNDAGCVEPVDATCDEDWEITKEIYGYGFTLEQLQTAVDNAAYGEEFTIDLYFRAPQYTEEYFRGELFQDTLSSWSTKLSTDKDWNSNLQLVCELLNGVTINTGETFSFNTTVGKPTVRAGFKAVKMYLGKSYQEVVGGGISQAASMLYYCALKADLEILERNGHSFALEFIRPGFDAEVNYDSMDLRFRNNTNAPIRIVAEISNGKLYMTLLGSDTRTYTVDLSFKIEETFKYGTVTNTMTSDNPGGYLGGEILRPGMDGYLVSTFITRYDKETGNALTETVDGVRTDEILIAQTYYAKQDEVVVEIYTPPVLDPVDPPVDPDDPDNPDSPPVDPDNPDNPDNPDVPPVDPDDPDTPPVDPENPDNPPVDPENPDDNTAA